MAHTTIPAYVKFLVSNLKERPGLSTIDIHGGPPIASTAQKGSKLWFGDVKGEQSWVSIARSVNPKEENYTVDGVIDIIATTRDMDSVVDAAFAILAEVEDHLRANPDQGITHVIWSGINGPIEHYKRRSDQVAQCVIYFGIEVKARI